MLDGEAESSMVNSQRGKKSKTLKLSEITAVILAGGLGIRLRTAAPDKQKVMADILGKPFLTFLFDQLIASGLRNVVLCTGYLSNQIRVKLGHTYKSLRLIYSAEKEPLGTGGALCNSLSHIVSNTVLVMNGDSFVNIDLITYMEWFFRKNLEISLLLVRVPNTDRYGKVSIAKDDRIMSFVEKGKNCGPGWINGGIYIIKKDILTSLSTEAAFSLERDTFPKMMNKGMLYGFRSNGEFIDIGTPETYLAAEYFFKRILQENRIHEP